MKSKYIISCLAFISSIILSYGQNTSHCESPNLSQYDTEYQSKINTSSVEDSYCIKIYVHIIRRSDGTGGQLDFQADTAIDILNMDFAPSQISFHWDNTIDYIDNDIYFDQPNHTIFWVNNHTDGIDIYLFDDNYDETYSGGLANDAFGSSELYVAGSYWHPPYGSVARSSILTHEMGHILGLYHTHRGCETGNWEEQDGSNCATNGDEVCDTPRDPNMNWNVNPSDCTWTGFSTMCTDAFSRPPLSSFNPDEKNFMAYTHPDCMEHFSSGQTQRMKNKIATLSHLQNLVVACPSSCPANLLITETVQTFNSDIQEASDRIIARNHIEYDANAEYDAGKFVRLGLGFHAKAGSTFRAYIDGCSTTNPAARGTNKIKNISEILSLYPNPAKDQITISITSQKIESYELYDIYGKMIRFKTKTNSYSEIINVDKLNRGIYILKVILENNSVINKNIILK